MNNPRELKIEAQKKLCKDKDYPHFAPTDGICWTCNKDIYERISLEDATDTLITGCPVCNRTYCD